MTFPNGLLLCIGCLSLLACRGPRRALQIDTTTVRIGQVLPYRTITNTESTVELPDGKKETTFSTEITHCTLTLKDRNFDGSSVWLYQVSDWQSDQHDAKRTGTRHLEQDKTHLPPVSFVLSAAGIVREWSGREQLFQQFHLSNQQEDAPTPYTDRMIAGVFTDTSTLPYFLSVWHIFPSKNIKKGQKWRQNSIHPALNIRIHTTYRLAARSDSSAIVQGSISIEPMESKPKSAQIRKLDIGGALAFQYQIAGSGHSETILRQPSGIISQSTSVTNLNGIVTPLVWGTGTKPIVLSVKTTVQMTAEPLQQN